MDKQHYYEMENNLLQLKSRGVLHKKSVYLFGHCNATEELVVLLEKQGIKAKAILDNNSSKHGTSYLKVPIVPPKEIINDPEDNIVLIAARAFESMESQLRALGYKGDIEKLVEYNSFSEYSLSEETIEKRYQRVQRGISKLNLLNGKYPGKYRILCPFPALGDVFYAMSYLPQFLNQRNISDYVVCVVGASSAKVVEMFNHKNIVSFSQVDMDEIIQAELFSDKDDFFIPHNDKPYVVQLYKALYVKMIPFEIIYKCGVYGLPNKTEPVKPSILKEYLYLNKIKKNQTLIISPYAKSVSNIPMSFWDKIINDYTLKGFDIYTNTVGDEEALQGTKRIEIPLDEMQSAVEYAGNFIGLRSGLCDVIKYADCKKTVVYPDRCFSDTKWKMAEIFHLDGWKNLVIGEEKIHERTDIINITQNMDF